MARNLRALLPSAHLMSGTTFILGTDPTEHCAELEDMVQARLSDTPVIVTSREERKVVATLRHRLPPRTAK